MASTNRSQQGGQEQTRTKVADDRKLLKQYGMDGHEGKSTKVRSRTDERVVVTGEVVVLAKAVERAGRQGRCGMTGELHALEGTATAAHLCRGQTTSNR